MPQENIHIQQEGNDERPHLRIVEDVQSDSDETVAQFGDFNDKATQHFKIMAGWRMAR
jgi:hypothetical protein